jgi:colanic acid/amylovoran biosynthesis glycosyltransferase
MRACRAAPKLAFEVVDPRQYGHEAASLSALYRLSILGTRPRRYDVVHAHFGPIGNSFRFARSLWEAPLVVSFHGYDFSTWPRRKGAGVYRRLFDCTDIVTVNSDYARGRLEALGCPPGAIRKLPYALTLADFPFQPRVLRHGEPVRILTVARLVAKKGVEHSVRAVAALRHTHPDVRYDIIGDGPLRPSIEDLIRRDGLEGSVTLHGARDGDYVKQMMRQAHLFVLASVTAANGDQEGTPVSLLEAQASGLPVVSTLHSGIPEVVMDGESGFLVPEGDVASLAARLVELTAHPERWAAMGRSGRRRMEGVHDVSKVNRQLTELYSEAALRYRDHCEAVP